MAEEVDDVVGPKGRHDVDRAAVRHGSAAAGEPRPIAVAAALADSR